MTTTDLTALLNADLTDATNRNILADCLNDAGRDVEALIARAVVLPVETDGKRLLPDLTGDDPDSNDDAEGTIGRERGGWINCKWGTIRVGGCWIHSESTAAEQNNCRGLSHPSMPNRVEAGDVEAYSYGEIGDIVEAGDALGINPFGEDAVDKLSELSELIQIASERECKRVMEEYLATARLTAVREAFEEATNQWTGCDWTTQHGDTGLDLQGLTPDDCRYRADRVRNMANEYENQDSVPVVGTDWEKRHATNANTTNCPSDHLYLVASDYESGADYLTHVEQDAALAFDSADEALGRAEEGNWDEAVEAAERACAIESTYGDHSTWRAFRDAVRVAAEGN